MQAYQLAQYIDHTALSAEKTEQDILTLCDEAIDYGFYAICINPCHIPLAKEKLKGSHIKICTVIGFPLGANATAVKAFEAQQAIEAGANEIDMVINIGWLKSGLWAKVEQDIAQVKQICDNIPLKVILETCLLSPEEITQACEICKQLKVAFVKTSTGFNKGGATLEDVKLMHSLVANSTEVKASGGIRDTDTALAMINAGATRIGTSSGVAIIHNLVSQTQEY
ncbi:deoxyribose-phosphate aldolase [Volucribacter psittacicida]|uniref:Deoxyribose-phosphate aldolase n=1 Tax=Volucribacter psittacicida TaxID=203482 RepID=A0A4R1FQP8_9PAST|nr:deoxyribose-phosphate aldolase [Volucribacter psittacicida]TCJ95922.1 deoxyribose-phosphate aldolase [Volucribacter psittacicida]